MSSGPMVSKQIIRDHAQSADTLWDMAIRAFDLYPERLRMLAEGANAQARVIRLAELGDITWKPREDARDMRLAPGLEPDGREGPPELWEEFDQNLRALGEAMETDVSSNVYLAFEALRDSALKIADALESPVEVEDPVTRPTRQRRAS
jgi:hypothetical protein